MIKEDGTRYGNLAGWPGVRIMSLNPRIAEMIRRHCDVGQIERTRFYMARSFFWKDEDTIITYDESTKFFILPPLSKTSQHQESIERALRKSDWREDIKQWQEYRGNPWNSPYYRDSRLSRRGKV